MTYVRSSLYLVGGPAGRLKRRGPRNESLVTGYTKGTGAERAATSRQDFFSPNNELIKPECKDQERWLELYLLSACANIDGRVDVCCRLAFCKRGRV